MTCKMKSRAYIFILFILLFSACGASKTTQAISRSTISHIQPDTCLTDKQLRLYFNFVKDSMKIESKNEKQRANKEIDSLKIELKKHRSDNEVIKYVVKFDTKRFNDSISTISKMYADSLSAVVKVNKQENKTDRVEIRQENRTERAKLNRWVIFFIGLGLGFLFRFIWQLIKVLYL